MVAMLADFKSGESRPQVHTIREITVQKKDDEFVFPLKDMYELQRNTISVPQTFDSSAERPDDDEPSDPNKRTTFDVPLILESDKSKDASITEQTLLDPKPLSENTSDSVGP